MHTITTLSAVTVVAFVMLSTPGVAVAQVVHAVYLVPSDRTVRDDYREGVDIALRDLQWFYQSQLGDGRTFSVDPAGVLVLQSTRPASWFSTNRPSGFVTFYDNVRADVEALTGRAPGSLHAGPDVWVLYADALHACGQCGGCGGNRVTVIDVNDLHGLVGERFEPACPTDFDTNTRCRWIGGLGHELGHTMGLPHPPGCDAGLSTCDQPALMWSGYARYPNTYLRADDKATLAASPYLAPHPLLSPAAVCGPVAPAAPRAFAAATSGSTLTLTWNVPQSAGAPTQYTLFGGSSPGLSDLARLTFNAPTTSFQTVAPPGSYFLRLLARNSSGTSGLSTEINARVGLPGIPADLIVRLQGRVATIEWTAPEGVVSGYVLEAGTQSGRSDLATLPVSGTSFVSPVLPPGRYFVRVRATGPAGAGPASNDATIDVPLPTLPGSPNQLVATVAGSVVVLTWQAPNSGGAPLDYLIEVGRSPGLANLGTFPAGPVLSLAAGGVPPGTYYVRVRARGEAGMGSPSNEVLVVVP